MKAWTRIAGRPVGREPAVYFVKPPQPPIEGPWDWEVEEWDSVEEAIKAVITYLPPEYCLKGKGYEEYYDSFRFITKLEKE